jgi:flagellar hook protein FlgE
MVLLQLLSVLVCAVSANGAAIIGETPTSVIAGAVSNQWTQAGLRETDKPFELGIQGHGFFVLEGLHGEEQFTRYGEFRLNEEGFLTHTSSGQRLLGFCHGHLEPIKLADFANDPGDESHSSESVVKTYRTDFNGEVTAIYANGHVHPTCTIALALFYDSSQLKRSGVHVLIATKGAGDGFIDRPKLFGRGGIYSHTLEEMDAEIYKVNLKGTGVDRLSDKK